MTLKNQIEKLNTIIKNNIFLSNKIICKKDKIVDNCLYIKVTSKHSVNSILCFFTELSTKVVSYEMILYNSTTDYSIITGLYDYSINLDKNNEILIKLCNIF